MLLTWVKSQNILVGNAMLRGIRRCASTYCIIRKLVTKPPCARKVQFLLENFFLVSRTSRLRQKFSILSVSSDKWQIGLDGALKKLLILKINFCKSDRKIGQSSSTSEKVFLSAVTKKKCNRRNNKGCSTDTRKNQSANFYSHLNIRSSRQKHLWGKPYESRELG